MTRTACAALNAGKSKPRRPDLPKRRTTPSCDFSANMNYQAIVRLLDCVVIVRAVARRNGEYLRRVAVLVEGPAAAEPSRSEVR